MIQVFRPIVDTERILNELRPILNSGWIGLGPKTKEFEKKLSEFIGAKHFVALNSATAGLHLAVKCLDLPPSSKIITTPNTFVSTNHAILYEGHVPVFCDIEKTTGNISVESIEEALKEDPTIKAIIVVHVGGYSCDMDKINKIAKEHNLKVIEDCAHAFGGIYNDNMIGDSDNMCVWSFQAVKNLPVGDGGAISTNDDALYERLNKLRWLGINKDTVSRSNLNSEKQTYNWDYEVEEVGYKYHAADITSVMGIIGLETINQNNIRRREIAKYYLNNINNVIKPDYQDNRVPSSHFLPLFFEDRDVAYNALKDNGIFCGMHYKRNDKYKPFIEFKKTGGLINAEWYENHELTLPMHLGLTDNDLETIVHILNNR
jgi:perosamine synthetase